MSITTSGSGWPIPETSLTVLRYRRAVKRIVIADALDTSPSELLGLGNVKVEVNANMNVGSDVDVKIEA